MRAVTLPFLVAVLSLVPAGAHAGEVERIQYHLDGALELLASRDLSSLTPEQRARRAENVRRLIRYRDTGAFPKNRDFPGSLVPYFRDADGTLCAMGYLIAESGHWEIVESVERVRNNAKVRDLVDEPGLVDWLDENGLTVEEAARIQPGYWGGTLRYETQARYFDVGACTGAIRVSAVNENGSPAAGDVYLSVSPQTDDLTLFRDTQCATAISGGKMPLSAGTATFAMRATVAGQRDVSISYSTAYVTQRFTFGTALPDGGSLPDPGPDHGHNPPPHTPRGCAATAGGPTAFALLALLRLRRRRG